MKNNSYLNWQLRAGGTISVLYLLLFATSEAYSAAATAFDTKHSLTSWEPHLGWAFFILPISLIASLFFLHGRRSRLGYSFVVINLCLYAIFFIFESIASGRQPISKQAVWEVGGVWLGLFLAALLAAQCLKYINQAPLSLDPRESWIPATLLRPWKSKSYLPRNEPLTANPSRNTRKHACQAPKTSEILKSPIKTGLK